MRKIVILSLILAIIFFTGCRETSENDPNSRFIVESGPDYLGMGNDAFVVKDKTTEKKYLLIDGGSGHMFLEPIEE